MPATSHTRAGSRSSLFNGRPPLEQDLPSGSCNYRDLSIGSRAPLCGCQRFFLNVGQHAPDSISERAWCFCGHHACFHNAFSEQSRGQEQASAMSPRIMTLPDDGEMAQMNNTTTLQQPPPSLDRAPAGLGIQSGSQSQSHSINTRLWEALNGFARDQEDGVPSISTSRLPSTAAPSVVDDTRVSPARAGPPLPQAYRSMGPPVYVPQALPPRATEDYSATEVATPSIAGTPDFRAQLAAVEQPRTSPLAVPPRRLKSESPRAGRSNSHPDLPTKDAHLSRNPAASLQDLHNLIRTYSQRLEALESLSFSQIPYEEIQERFDHFEGRILDMEHWRDEQEKQQSTPESDQASRSKRRRLLPDETGSFTSDASFDSNAAAHAEAAVLATLAANAETHPRIDALESRVADLEASALPSYARPWQVEVVFLPWSRDLKGIWFSSHEATQHSLRSATQASEEWTTTQAETNLSFKSTIDGAWTTQSIEAWANEAGEWLSPKACGPGGTVFQRLASRGLVKPITLTASDARHVFNTVNEALEDSFTPEALLTVEQTRKYQGLREPFIPLRKIRKSSRLRFLDPAEMATSAIWTAEFLDSSVFMKTGNGQRRLYVTTPSAYVQPPDSPLVGWEHIRRLARNTADEEEPPAAQHSVPESCWAYHENLDHPHSIHSSFGSHVSQWSTESQPDDNDTQDLDPRPPMSPWSESRIPHQRTVSLPNSASASSRMPGTVPQRRVASFGTVAKHDHDDEAHADIVAKRRRISLSPEAERRGVNFTPRWSREPPSPFASEGAVESKSQGTGSRKRGTTPFAYATPHSNSNFAGRTDFVPGDGDTEVATDILGPSSDHGEEEWEGVDDDYMSEDRMDGRAGTSTGSRDME